MVMVFAAFVLGSFVNPQTIYQEETTTIEIPHMIYEPYSDDIMKNPDATSAMVIVPAVDQDGNGVATILQVHVVPGSGRALVNIDKLLFWVDTQNSIRIARSVAEAVSGIDLSKNDIVFTITANASVVEGPSAGAALTVATIAALLDKKTNSSVMMTGTMNPDGTIGPIGGVLEKAKAAKAMGAEVFLVPEGQSIEVKYDTIRKCETVGWSEYCTIETVPVSKDVETEAEIRVVEVSNINDALNYFLLD